MSGDDGKSNDGENHYKRRLIKKSERIAEEI